jgi:hypothetical protein
MDRGAFSVYRKLGAACRSADDDGGGARYPECTSTREMTAFEIETVF